MSDNLVIYLLPFFSAVAGMFLAYLIRNAFSSILKLVLAFSGALLIGIIFLKMLPHIFSTESEIRMGLFVLIGILLQITVELFSQGVEHGHAPSRTSHKTYTITLIIGLGIHSFFEGIPLVEYPDLLWGMGIHKLTIGFVLFLVIWFSDLSIYRRIAFLFIFSIMTPLGSMATGISLLISIKHILIPISVGMLLHVSTQIIFEQNTFHRFDLINIAIIVLGMGLAYFI